MQVEKSVCITDGNTVVGRGIRREVMEIHREIKRMERRRRMEESITKKTKALYVIDLKIA